VRNLNLPIDLLMSPSLFPFLRYPRFCLPPRNIPKKSTRQFIRPIQVSVRIRTSSHYPSKAMAATEEMLATKLKSLSVAPLPKYPNCHPEINPVDIYRAHLTEILTEVTGVDAAVIYPALQWTQTLEKGDLVLPVPALRLKSKKPSELAAEWVEKVCSAVYHCPCFC